MVRRMLVMLLSGSMLALSSVAPSSHAQMSAQPQARQQFYGSQLMTPQERLQYREQMRNAKTEQERQQLRLEHHQQMQQRARQKGVTLPDEPPANRGMGSGMGGGGMGGGGMGGGGMGGGGMGGGGMGGGGMGGGRGR